MTLVALVLVAGVARADEPEPIKPPKPDTTTKPEVTLKTETAPVGQAAPCNTCGNGCASCGHHWNVCAWLCHHSATGKCGCCCCGYRQPSIYDYFICYPCRECAKYEAAPCASCSSCCGWKPFWATGHRLLPLPTGHGVLSCD
jgi:hypothetical protein